ncbi:nodulation protein NfeD [Desulfovibrio aminophilus]|nr:nodulation protein NfeD [Desulfovibrio aminophilus]MCM0756062.1 nodulation protein NfeD [Desulfovibrio aminophilus]
MAPGIPPRAARLFLFLLLLILPFALPSAPFCDAAKPSPKVLEVEISGAITPVQEDLLRDALARVRAEGHDLLLIRLDTPGGLLETMRGMVKDMLNAPAPVLVWVGPRGAQAASAGVFLVAASQVAGMAPQATIGSASPVAQGGEELSATMSAKVKADLISLVRGAAASRGRNADWYERAVSESVSLTAQDAVMQRVVEVLADDAGDFLAQAGHRGIPYSGGVLRFDAEQMTIEHFDPGFRHRFLSWLLHPQVAYFLMLGGLAGLFFELTTPGAVLPGVLGGLCLLLALYAMSVLPTSAAGAGLILLGLALFWLEVKITSYGLLGVAAVIALFLGSIILFDPSSGLPGLPLATVIVTVSGVSAFLALAVGLVVRAQRSRKALGGQAMLGLEAEVLDWSGGRGQVRTRGEIWSARSDDPLRPGDRVMIIGIDGLTLLVRPGDPGPASS